MVPPGLQLPPNCDLTLGMVCVDKSVPGRSVWEMTADQRFANPAGVCQGGFLAACCDSAMGAAVVTFAAGRRVRLANADLNISFLRPVAIGSRLTCEAVVVSGGARVVFVEATITAAAPPSEPPAEETSPALGEGAPIVARASSTYLLSDRS